MSYDVDFTGFSIEQIEAMKPKDKKEDSPSQTKSVTNAPPVKTVDTLEATS